MTAEGRCKQVVITCLIMTALLCATATLAAKNWRTDPSASQLDLNEGAARDFDAADEKLNKLYQLALKRHKGDALFLQKFQKAQQLWIAFRDAHMEALYPATDKRGEYGSVYPMCYSIEMTVLTEARSEQLENWAHGVQEGDVCGGSYGIKDH